MIKLRCTERSGKSKERKIELEKMSYSRWIDSKFYTYWNSTKVYNKEDEIFICHTDIQRYYGFTYTECKKYIEDAVSVKGRINEIDDDTQAEELQRYMRQFVEDVDREYQPNQE
jgi:hypothetical protein|tara:strand:- start:110 stop:451 length:342 start_codon:yes stop_codon:yes gene_type:complete